MLIYELRPSEQESADPTDDMAEVIVSIIEGRDAKVLGILKNTYSEADKDWKENPKKHLSKDEILLMLDGCSDDYGVVFTGKLCIFFSFDANCDIISDTLHEEEIEAILSKKISLEIIGTDNVRRIQMNAYDMMIEYGMLNGWD